MQTLIGAYHRPKCCIHIRCLTCVITYFWCAYATSKCLHLSIPHSYSRRQPNAGLMLGQRLDAGPALNQHWVEVCCFLPWGVGWRVPCRLIRTFCVWCWVPNVTFTVTPSPPNAEHHRLIQHNQTKTRPRRNVGSTLGLTAVACCASWSAEVPVAICR